MTNKDRKLFLLDAYALIFRAYYAFIKNPRINSKGLNTSAIFGFTNTLFDLMKKEKPTHLIVVFDTGGENFRHKEYKEYKANRQQTPEAIRTAIPIIKNILKALKIPEISKQGYEADDIIGTLAKKAEKKGYTTYMMTSDKDYAQLVDDHTFVYKPASKGNDVEIWTVETVKERFGVKDPKQVIDLLGMMGDSIDNIPGLPGVGEKTAKQFIKEFGSIENLYKNIDQVKGKLKEKIIENEQLGLLSKRLATIDIHVPIEFNENEFILEKPDLQKINEIFEELEFRSMLSNLNKTYSLIYGSIANNASNTQNTDITDGHQFSLFDYPNEIERIKTDKTDSLNTDHYYQLLDNELALELLISDFSKKEQISFSVDAFFQEFDWTVTGISFSSSPHKSYYLPFYEKNQSIIKLLQTLFSIPSCKIVYDIKETSKLLRKYNIEIEGEKFDLMIARYLINPDAKHDLYLLSENILNYTMIDDNNYLGKGKNRKSLSSLSNEKQKEYLGEKSDVFYQLKGILENQLSENKLNKLFNELEMPLAKVLEDMEWEGISIDQEALKNLSKELDKDMEQLEKTVYELAGEIFNLNSPKQLGEIIFDKLKLSEKPKKTKTGQYATSEDILLKLSFKHEIIEDLLEYRQLQKLKSTYVDSLPNYINPKTGRIHTSFAQTVAATGRLASNNPNLQNIPIKTKRGQEIRKAFIAKNDKYRLISADYSQIELRVIASMSQDPAMIRSFKAGEDFHKATAAHVFKVPLEEVTRKQRSQAKTVNFGIIYGVSAFGLSEQTGLSRSEAKSLIDAYYEAYPVLKQYIQEQIKIAREKGYVKTLLGRRRYLADIHSSNSIVRSHAERNAVNAPIQGTAADIIKIAMINISNILKKNNFETKLLLQVHDELVFETPVKEAEEISHIIKNTMENAFKMEVPLIVDIGVGNNWLEAH